MSCAPYVTRPTHRSRNFTSVLEKMPQIKAVRCANKLGKFKTHVVLFMYLLIYLLFLNVQTLEYDCMQKKITV